MKKQVKRFFSLLLTLLMLVSLLPTALAEGEAAAGPVEEPTNDAVILSEAVEPEEASLPAVQQQVEEPAPVDDDTEIPAAEDAALSEGDEEQSEAEEADAEASLLEEKVSEADDKEKETPSAAGEEEAPQDTEVTPEETVELVRVIFICEPEDALITVYDPAQLDGTGEPMVIEPEEDGSYLLLPGTYLYDAEREGSEQLDETDPCQNHNAGPGGQRIRILQGVHQ